MIVVLTANESPCLIDLDRLDRLHAELHGELGAAQLGSLCTLADDHHVWIDVGSARSTGISASHDATLGEQFDGMIAYAERKGWLDDARTSVRAHIEHAD